MKVYFIIFLITSWCFAIDGRQKIVNSYIPNSYTSSLSQNTFETAPESSFGFSEPSGFGVTGFTSPAKLYVRQKPRNVLPRKYEISASGYEAPHSNYYEEEYHQSPTHYEYRYVVHDHHHGSEFGHAEYRQGDTAKGQYMVLLPDGRRQIVDYVADKHGYRPTIRYEGGHDNVGYGR